MREVAVVIMPFAASFQIFERITIGADGILFARNHVEPELLHVFGVPGVEEHRVLVQVAYFVAIVDRGHAAGRNFAIGLCVQLNPRSHAKHF
jgi:hypothetical protein